MSDVCLFLSITREKGLTIPLNYVVILSSLAFDGIFDYLRTWSLPNIFKSLHIS